MQLRFELVLAFVIVTVMIIVKNRKRTVAAGNSGIGGEELVLGFKVGNTLNSTVNVVAELPLLSIT